MKKALLALSLALTLALTACQKAEVKRYEASFIDVFDTYSQVVVYSADKAFAQEIAQQAHDELKEYHQLYDIYNEYDGLNNLKTVNDSAGIAPVAVDARIIELLQFAKDMHAQTGGRMNVAMGSVLRLWHDARERGTNSPADAALPDMDALRAAAEHVSIDDVVLDAEAGTVLLPDPAMRLDVGAVAKGYAVERVAQALEARGVTSALLSIGGNVRAIGERNDGTRWVVSIQNPDLSSENQHLTRLGLKDLSLVTSGDYQRYFTVDGQRYHHIIDPDTLMPAAYFSEVSIVTRDSGLADALSTALFTLPLQDGQALLDRFEGAEALWVTPNGDIVRSDGFSQLAQELE